MVGNKTNRTGNLVEGPVRKYACGVGLFDNHVGSVELVVLLAENELHAALIHSQDAGDGDCFAALEDLRCDLQVSEF